MKLKPIKGKIVVKPEIQERTKSGIFIPERDSNLPERGVVIAVGSEVKEVKAGDKIVFNRLGYLTKFEEDGVEYIIINEKVISCVIE